jgi:hypothetical protein
MRKRQRSPAFPRLRKVYLVGNGLALVITLLAGVINLVVGPRNPGIFLVVLFQLGFASLALLAVDGMNSGPRNAPPPPLWIRLNGIPLMRTNAVDARPAMSVVFLCFVLAFFLLVSVLLLYEAITGSITPLESQR